jgi:hypothetical protein
MSARNRPYISISTWSDQMGWRAKYVPLSKLIGGRDEELAEHPSDSHAPPEGWGAGSGAAAWDDITDKPATFPPSAHNHDAAYVNVNDVRLTDARTPTPHAHDWDSVTGKPATFAPSAHNHDATYQALSAKGQANGYAGLDGDGKVPAAQLPDAQGGGVTMAQVIDTLYPVGSLYTSTLSTNPGALLSRGTWEVYAAGRALVGVDTGDTDWDTGGETRGTKTVASAGTVAAPVLTMDPITSVLNHTHPVTITDNGHAHSQRYHAAATGGLSGPTTVPDTSSNTPTNYGLTTASATTGITAATSNPSGGVASIPVTGTASAPAFTGSATSVIQPSIAVYVWRRTA